MGSAARTVEETVDYLNVRGYKSGVLEVKLYRPWPAEIFCDALPKTCKQICVLDRTREDGASGPLYLDVVEAISSFREGGMRVIGGQYGLSSKEFTPNMVKGCYDNLAAE